MVAKSIAVAETTLAGHKVQFYMNPSGHDKLSSTIPCVAWMMKISEKDPLWDAHVDGIGGAIPRAESQPQYL